MTEDEVEAAVKAKGLTHPRLTQAHISSRISSEAFYVFPDTSLTVCTLTLLNGFVVTGESASASLENFDEALGRNIARGNARNKIWALEGYLLRQKLHEAQLND